MSKLGKRLINAAKSAQAIAKGEADPKTYGVHVPAHLDVRAIRTKLKMSQNAFAARFGILPSTLRDWEQNRRHPDEPLHWHATHGCRHRYRHLHRPDEFFRLQHGGQFWGTHQGVVLEALSVSRKSCAGWLDRSE